MKCAATALLLLSACGGSPCGPTSAVVKQVVDGDTIELEGDVKVRYLLVDTPETTNGKNDCYGAQARDFNRSLVEGKTVELSYDTECKDRFNRLLAYVKVEGREVNTLMIERGYACVLYVAPNGEKRKAEFEDLQSIAKTERRGLWGSCTSSPCGG